MAAPSLPYEDWLIEQLKDPAEAAAYLETVIEEGHQSAIMLALRQGAQAHGRVAEIARKAKLTREATYKMLSKSGKLGLNAFSTCKAVDAGSIPTPASNRTEGSPLPVSF